MSISIISNAGATQVGTIANNASDSIQASLIRLSTGNKITKASDGVAELAVGTILKTQVSTLSAALSNTKQAGALLGLMEGGLTNISELLQRQSSIAAQATSGVLSDKERAYLDIEFQTLVAQINTTAETTEFNGIKLINGSIYDPSAVETDSEDAGVAASAKFAITTALGDADAIEFNGVQFVARSTANMGKGTPDLNFDITLSSAIEDQIAAIKTVADNVKNYAGTDIRVLDAKARLGELDFSTYLNGNSSYLTVTSKAAGASSNAMYIGGTASVTTGVITVNGTTATTKTIALGTDASLSKGVDGSLNAGQAKTMNASGTLRIGTAFAAGDDGITISFNGADFTLMNGSLDTDDTALLEIDVSAFTTKNTQMAEIYHKLREVQTYSGTDSTVLAAKDALADLTFEYDGYAGLKIISNQIDTVADTYGNDIAIAGGNFAAGAASLDGVSIDNTSLDLATLYRGTYMTNAIRDAGKLDGYKAAGTINISTAAAVGDDAITLSINGVDIALSATATYGAMTADEKMLAIEVEAVDTTIAQQVAAIKAIYDGVLAYTGSDATVLAAQTAWQDITITTDGISAVKIAANNAGRAGNDIVIQGGNFVTAVMDINGENLDTVTTTLATPYRGTFVRENSAYEARGTVSDNVLLAIDADNVYKSGVDVSNVSNNDAFVGTISGFTASKGASDDYVKLAIKVGDYNYEAYNVPSNSDGDVDVTLSSVEAGGGSFTIRLQGGKGSAVTDDTTAADYAERLDKAFSTVSIYQDRGVDSYTASGTITPAGSSTVIGDLTGTSVKFTSNNFKDVEISAVEVIAPSEGATNATIKFTIGDDTYVSESTLGSSIAANTTLRLVNANNPFQKFEFTNGDTELELDSDDKAAAVAKALSDAFGIASGQGAISFQVGSSSANTIQIQLKGTSTDKLYVDDSGNIKTLSVGTAAGASEASAVLVNAISYVTSRIAEVGALQSRFQSAGSSLETSIRNLDSARSIFLDADIAKESTNFAMQQVRLQASYAMLAQANSLSQGVLKLLNM